MTFRVRGAGDTVVLLDRHPPRELTAYGPARKYLAVDPIIRALLARTDGGG